MFDDAKDYVASGLREQWDNFFKVYKGQRVIYHYEGLSSPVIRESHTIIETLVANIAGGNPKFMFIVTNEEQSDDTDVLNGMVEYYMYCNQMQLKNQEWVRDALMYGTGILGIEWREGKPFIFNIPLRDFFVDPTSTGLVNTINPARYAGYEYLTTRKALEAVKVFDADKNEWVPKYTNLDNVGLDTDNKNGGATDNTVMDKTFKDMFAGSTLGDKATKRQMHVIKLYDLDTGRLVEIANRKGFIYNKPMWTQREEIVQDVELEVEASDGSVQIIPSKQKLNAIKPFLPFAALRDYIDSSQFYGSGEMELLINDAELLNDLEAMIIDNNAYQNTPMYWIDPQFADLAPEIETISGAVYPIPRNAIGVIERPQLGADLENKQQNIMNRMRRATAADEAVQGVGQQRSRTTATEVSTQLEQAHMRFRTKIQNLESEGFAHVGQILQKVIQIFVTKETVMRVLGKKGVVWKDYDPYEFNGEYEVHVQLESTVKNKEMEVGMKRNQMYEVMQNRAHFDPVEVDRWMLQHIDRELTDEEYNKLLAPPAEPDDEVKDFVNVGYKDLEPWGKLQWQKSVGWEPDPGLLADIKNRMIEQAGTANDMLDPMTDTQGNPLAGLEQLQPMQGQQLQPMQ